MDRLHPIHPSLLEDAQAIGAVVRHTAEEHRDSPFIGQVLQAVHEQVGRVPGEPIRGGDGVQDLQQVTDPDRTRHGTHAIARADSKDEAVGVGSDRREVLAGEVEEATRQPTPTHQRAVEREDAHPLVGIHDLLEHGEVTALIEPPP